jgi:hypothetical protein
VRTLLIFSALNNRVALATVVARLATSPLSAPRLAPPLPPKRLVSLIVSYPLGPFPHIFAFPFSWFPNI